MLGLQLVVVYPRVQVWHECTLRSLLNLHQYELAGHLELLGQCCSWMYIWKALQAHIGATRLIIWAYTHIKPVHLGKWEQAVVLALTSASRTTTKTPCIMLFQSLLDVHPLEWCCIWHILHDWPYASVCCKLLVILLHTIWNVRGGCSAAELLRKPILTLLHLALAVLVTAFSEHTSFCEVSDWPTIVFVALHFLHWCQKEWWLNA